MSRLIVNADDYGYTGGINRAVQALHTLGALSSATAMATGNALGSGLSTRVSLGCHIVLVDGRPAAELSAIPSLLAPDCPELPVFRPTLLRFLADLQRGRIRDREIEAEAVAQIQALQQRGIQLTHVDTHKHTHMFPRVLRPVLRAALQCGVKAVRNPFEPEWARAATHGAPWTRRLEVSLLARYRHVFLKEVTRAGLRTTSGALGVLATGSLDTPTLRAVLAALARRGEPTAAYELVCHPGYVDAELQAQRTRLQGAREVERAALAEVIPDETGPLGAHSLIDFTTL
ncbi:ChbG/HpnK family deacetylase [Acidipila sp. EB88]|uniref:ChbG/HpnK family deacetylase n=1 Tax=Acidipila sp. EB88 TaxID=2305226 RepID=UPI000F5E3554|nr:ChbG/HpnK family deacetylase [Acidipila sp. EB88]RRA49683.1 ChbG/HpnK family deacetylase [Acidipila sp. EB88]